MTLSIYNKASVDSLLSGKASLSGATFTGGITATGLTITSGSGGVLTFSDGTTQSTAGGSGGASWGSITGTITNQTDLIGYFANYLPLSGGTLTGSLTTASAGITFADASVQTTAATNFIGGSISTPITYGNMTTDSYFGADIIGVELTGTGQNSVLQYSGLQVTDGSQTSFITPTQIGTTDGVNEGLIVPSYFYITNGTISSYYTAGYIQFADGSTQTTAATSFTGGTVNNPIYIFDGTNTLEVASTGITFADGSFMSSAGVGSVAWGSITGSISAQTDLQNQFAGYLPISGGAMSGGLTLGGNMNADGYEINNCNFNSPAGQVASQNLVLTYGDGGSVTFADGSIQTTAASSGYSALQATTDAIASCVAINQQGVSLNFYLIGFAGFSCWNSGKFTSGSSYLIGIGSASPIYFTAGFDPSGYAIGSASAFSCVGCYLYYSENGGSTWTQSSFPIA